MRPLPQVPADKANHALWGYLVALAVFGVACGAALAWNASARWPVPLALMLIGALVLAPIGAYAVGRVKEWADARANARAAAAGLPPPHSVEVADANATLAGGAMFALPVLLVLALVLFRGLT